MTAKAPNLRTHLPLIFAISPALHNLWSGSLACNTVDSCRQCTWCP